VNSNVSGQCILLSVPTLEGTSADSQLDTLPSSRMFGNSAGVNANGNNNLNDNSWLVFEI